MLTYDAFISYSHSKDKPTATALQSVVQKLGKPWYKRRALRVFRDDTSLSATPNLWPSIEHALGQSRFFILLASPEAAASQWVKKEVAYWLEHKSTDTLLFAVTDGKLTWDNSVSDFDWSEATPLPPVLAGRFPTEPKWVDLRAYRNGANLRDAKFTELAADFAAAIHGIPKDDLLSQEVRQQRHALTLAWSAATSLIIAAGAASWQWNAAIKSQRLAVVEATRADRNFGAAKSTIDAVIFDLAQGLKDVEGMRVETVRQILGRAEAAVDQLASRTENIPDVRNSQAAMFTLFSDTYLKLGATQLAADYARKATNILRDLAAQDPGNTQLLRDQSASLERVGDVYRYQGDLSDALAAYREGLDIRRALAVKDPGNTQLWGDQSLNLERIADVLVLHGDFDGALAAHREGLAIRRGLAVKDPDNTGWRRAVSVSLNRVGDVLALQGDLGDALAAHREGLDISRALAVKDPDNTGWRRDISASLESIGIVLMLQGDLSGAMAAYRESLGIARELVAKDPGNTQWRRSVSSSLTKLGNVLGAQGNLAGAMAAHRESLDIARELVAKDPSNMQWQTDVVLSLTGLALVGDDSRGRWSEALAILKRLKSQGRLPSAQQEQIGIIEANLAKLARSR
jgi:tetratricopeptide (TPR) repeat protein